VTRHHCEWQHRGTGSFDISGVANVTNAIGVGNLFYIIRVP